ncbi:MAG: M48 family metalloprotease [Gemmatimonadota bacterium]
MRRGSCFSLQRGIPLRSFPIVVLVASLSSAPARPAEASPNGDSTPTLEAAKYFDSAFLQRSEAYNRTKILFALNWRAIRWAAYLTLLLTPFLAGLAAASARRWPERENLRVFVLAWVVLGITFLATAPISFASGHLQEHRYGLSRQSAAGWVADALKVLAVNGAATSLLTVLWFALRRRASRRGWAVFATAAVVAGGLATLVYPLAVDPLFHDFRSLEDDDLRRDILELGRREGVRVERVLVMEASAKTVRENAYVTGLGRTARVVLYDTLLENAPRAELRSTVAHELGHWSRAHVGKGLVLWAAAAPFLCWLLWSLHGRLSRNRALRLDGPADPASIPLVLLLLSVLLAVSDPFALAISRAFEREADRVALQLTQDPGTFIEAKRRSAVQNLGWVDPPDLVKALFWTHPTTLERIRMAESWGDVVGGAR